MLLFVIICYYLLLFVICKTYICDKRLTRLPAVQPLCDTIVRVFTLVVGWLAVPRHKPISSPMAPRTRNLPPVDGAADFWDRIRGPSLNCDDEIPCAQPHPAAAHESPAETAVDCIDTVDDLACTPSALETSETLASVMQKHSRKSGKVSATPKSQPQPVASSIAPAASSIAPAASSIAPSEAAEPNVYVVSPLIQLSPLCGKCKTPVDIMRAQLTGKGPGCWKCPSCNTKATQLNRVFGSWPPKSFAGMSTEWQQNFWKSLEGKPGGAALENFVVDSLVRQRVEQEQTTSGGEYLPLSVYAQRGFDTSRIVDLCHDTQEHPVLGTCYRVSIVAVYSKTIEEMIRSELSQSTGKRGSLADKPTKKRKQATSESDDSADGTSSSAKKDTKKTTKKKKAKKDTKKAKTKDSTPKSEAADKDRTAVANVRLATRTIAKVSSLVVLLRQHLKDSHLKNVPTFAVEPAKKSFATMEQYLKMSEDCLKKHGHVETLPWLAAELEQECQAGMVRASLLNKMLETARKHA